MANKATITGNQLMGALRNFSETAEVYVGGKAVTGVSDGGDGKINLETGGEADAALAKDDEGAGEGAAAAAGTGEGAGTATLTDEEKQALAETERLGGVKSGAGGGDDSAGEGDADVSASNRRSRR